MLSAVEEFLLSSLILLLVSRILVVLTVLILVLFLYSAELGSVLASLLVWELLP